MNKFINKEGSIHFKLSNPYLPAVFASIILMIVGQILTKGFLSKNNVSSILMTTSILTLASMAQATVVISGDMGLDMSIGSVMSLTALFGPMIILKSNSLTMIAAVIAVILMGAIIGLLNGIGVQYLKIVPLVMTLVMSSVVSGLALLITKGQPSVSVSQTLQSVGAIVAGPLRVLPVLVIMLLLILEIFMLNKSRYGRSLFLSGNNRNAANLSGINSRLVIILAYVFSGAVSGFAGLMLVGYAGSAQMHMADQYTMLSVASVVIGGTKLSGGKGSFVGGALGALVLILITNILQALNMPAGLRALIQGIILICVLMINSRAPKLRE
jgi:ribose transport system permease protein